MISDIRRNWDFLPQAVMHRFPIMSTREIIAELPHLTLAELRVVEQRIVELTSRAATGADSLPDANRGLRVERNAERLILAGPRVVRQAEVEAILDEFP
jgi:hypothetical protein